MPITLADLKKAVADLDRLNQAIFQDFTPLWDEDERTMQRALDTLHALIKETEGK